MRRQPIKHGAGIVHSSNNVIQVSGAVQGNRWVNGNQVSKQLIYRIIVGFVVLHELAHQSLLWVGVL